MVKIDALFIFVLLFIFPTLACAFTCPIDIQGERWVCEGETTVLTAAAGFSEYYWSNGQKGRSITVGPGAYQVVGRSEEGCVGSAEFLVGQIELPHPFGMKILGFSRVEGSLWAENRYTAYPYNERLDYIWTLDGDTIGQGKVLEMGPLPIGIYQLKVSAFSSCSGQSVSKFVLLQPYDGDTDTTTVFSCSSEPPYQYFQVPFSSPGLYDIVSVNSFDFQIAVRRNLQVEPQLSESYNTMTLCGGDPLVYHGKTISLPGSYDIPLINNFGCQELIHLEVQGPVDAPRSLETFTNCGPGGFEHEGEWYTAPGLYEEAYPMANGCDSLAFTFIEDINDLPSSEIHAEVCRGSLYHHDGLSYSEEGVYTRTYPLESGCDSIVAIFLSHRETFTEETNHYFCYGGSIEVNGEVFTESGAREYWAPGQGEACDSLFTDYVWELEPIEATVQLLTPDDGSGAGAIDLSLEGGCPPYRYEWPNGATTEDISGLSAGNYTLTVTDDIGCTASFTFELGLLSGISGQQPGSPLTLGPNPFREELQLFGPALPSGGLTLFLYDATGRLALRLPFSAQGTPMPSGLPGGLYWYRLEGAGELLSAGKIVRQ